MAGYTPLFNSIVTSSVWNEESETRIVWITMLALADADGKVEGSVAGLAPVARVSLPACIKALESLKAHDPYSRTREYEGRRIEEIEGGWQILNHQKFREKAKSRAEYHRKWRLDRHLTEKQVMEQKNRSRVRMLVSRAVRAGELPHPSTQKCVFCDKKAEVYYHPNGFGDGCELDVQPICKKCNSSLNNSLNNNTILNDKTKTQTQTQTARRCKTLRNSRKASKKAQKPTKDEFIKYVKDNKLNISDPESLFHGYEDGGWIDTQGNLVKNWKLKLRTLSGLRQPAETKPPPVVKNQAGLTPRDHYLQTEEINGRQNRLRSVPEKPFIR